VNGAAFFTLRGPSLRWDDGLFPSRPLDVEPGRFEPVEQSSPLGKGSKA
jgi:hypothetical protein